MQNDYYIYTYSFKNVPPERTLMNEEVAPAPTPFAALDNILASSELNFFMPDRSGCVERFGNKCVSPLNDGVTLIRLKNNRKVSLWRSNFERVSEPSYPFVNIIVDNRGGHRFLAIEKNRAFTKRRNDRNATLHVRDILLNSLNCYLKPYGLEIEIRPLTRQGEIWAAVSHRIRKKNVHVRNIELAFRGDDDAAQQKGALSLSQQLLASLYGDRALVHVDYDDGNSAIKKLKKDLCAIGLFCKDNRYELNVAFDDMSILRAGESLWAHFDIPLRDISNFEDGFTTFDEKGETTFDLNLTLDKINESIIDF